MKKKTKFMLPCCAAFAFVLVCLGIKTYGSHKEKNYVLLVQNVDALSQREEGTPVEDCYFDGGDETSTNVLSCDPKTTTKMIYKYPGMNDWVRVQSRGLCTK